MHHVAHRRSLTAAVVALSCAFPTGALLSHAVLESASTSGTRGYTLTVHCPHRACFVSSVHC